MTLVTVLAACDRPQAGLDYSVNHNFKFDVSDTDSALTYIPKANYRYGLIFYVDMGISPDKYSYLGESLAKQGYLVTIPKVSNNLSYFNYKQAEKAFESFPSVAFFAGGHGDGGGAAVRLAQENSFRVSGAALFAPRCYDNPLRDENGLYIKDEDGNIITIKDSIADMPMSALLIEPENDGILPDDIRAESKTRLPVGYTHQVISGGNHTSFSMLDVQYMGEPPLSAQAAEHQRELTVEITLAFLRKAVTA